MPYDIMSSLGTLKEPGGLESVLINAGEISLLSEVQAAAELMELDASSFSQLAVNRFLARAGSEDWTSLTSQANAVDDALGSVVVLILRKAVMDAREVFR